jgi:succinoglycan biosynthesis protein ExoM
MGGNFNPDWSQVAVCVCTYRRPAQLTRLLDSLLAIERPTSTAFVIVDNDGTDRDVERRVRAFASACPDRVEFVVERRPGICAARNSAVKSARRMGAGLIAMLDDDEWASVHWLAELLRTRATTGAPVVGGPVEPVFSEGRAPPAPYRRLWSVPPGCVHGRTYVYCTANCLIEMPTLDALGETPFDDRFGLTGGEDSALFRRLFFSGVKMAWAAGAALFQEFPPERADTSWIRRRWYRQGNIGVVCERVSPDPRGLAPLPKSLLLLARLPLYPLFNFEVFRAPLLWQLECERVRGRLARHLGVGFDEYARGPVARKKAAGAPP